MDLQTRTLAEHLRAAAICPQVVDYKTTTASTNDDVRELVEQGIDSVLICSAQQTQGRGQRHRQWASPKGNIYLSTLLHTNIPINGKLALEIGLNLLQLPLLAQLPLSLKWPNDLYSEHGKWGGILVEPIDAKRAIVGVGINLIDMSHVAFEQDVTSLVQLGLPAHTWQETPYALICQMYQAILTASQWFDHGSQNLAERFNHHAAFIQRPVSLSLEDGQQIHGIFQGIQEDGQLQIRTAKGVEYFYHGRLRLCTAHDWI